MIYNSLQRHHCKPVAQKKAADHVFATILPYILPRKKAFVKKLYFVKAM